ncbi:sulfatase [Gayadomonas joobiniege]|uniref:sulfatase family protein n=1 Tax=Gayadomonas joobiniege TaxID=1234606 RepID=UPI000361937B|nr:sulfatase [Gayadomonas joobiniege]
MLKKTLQSLTSALIGFSLFIFNHCALAAATHAKDKPYNIVFIVTDDESWFERSAYGFTKLKTPNFQAIADQGVLFENAHASAPSCAPSRASTLTGRHFWQLEQGAIIQAWLPKKFPTFVSTLKDNGYFVGRTGKGWGPGIFPPQAHKPDLAGEIYQEVTFPLPAKGMTAIDYVGNFEFMLNSRKEKQPFFAWIGIEEPHGPFNENNYQKLADEYGVTPQDLMVPGNMPDTPEYRKKRANFLYEVMYADKQIGRILNLLEQKNELNNTLLIVTSDNGTTPPASDFAKTSPYEAGTRVPMAIMLPGAIPAKRVVTDYTTTADIGPTILEAANVPIPTSMTGKSLWSILTSNKSGRVDPSRNFAVTGLEWHGEFDPKSLAFRAYRNDNYAIILRYNNVDKNGKTLSNSALTEPAKIELYDLKKDIWQLTDLAQNSQYQGIKNKLLHAIREYGVKQHDPRFTGDMDIFKQTRKFVIDRKLAGYVANPY